MRLTNCVAINDNATTDKPNTPSDGHGKNSQWGRFEVDESLSGLTVTTSEFMSAFPELFVDVTNHDELVAQRDEDGNLPETTFAHLKETWVRRLMPPTIVALTSTV